MECLSSHILTRQGHNDTRDPVTVKRVTRLGGQGGPAQLSCAWNARLGFTLEWSLHCIKGHQVRDAKCNVFNKLHGFYKQVFFNNDNQWLKKFINTRSVSCYVMTSSYCKKHIYFFGKIKITMILSWVNKQYTGLFDWKICIWTCLAFYIIYSEVTDNLILY